MMKKRLAAAMAVTMLASSLGMTAMAADPKTDVDVKVTSPAPDQLSVTVPTTLAIAVVAGGSNASALPDTLVGGSFAADGTLENAGTSKGSGNLTFSNASKKSDGTDMEVKIDSAKLTNNIGSKWRLVTTPVTSASASKFSMNLALAGQSAAAEPGDPAVPLTFSNLTIPANGSTNVSVVAQAGGNQTSYEAADEGLNKAFVVEWSISKVE